MAALNNVTEDSEKIEQLKQKGLTQGLAESIINSSKHVSRRYWIVDNSGSMGTRDGNRIIQNDTGTTIEACTRWQELGDSLKWHAEVSEILGVHTEFRMLNKTGYSRLPSKQVIVGSPGSSQAINGVLKSLPDAGTPLCAALRSVVSDIQKIAPELDENGKTVSVIIASDGEANDGNEADVREALAPLSDLPCDVVIRLCTDDESVVSYWNDIEANPELELDVLDDIGGEGVEVRSHNPWLGYGEALQRVREFGGAPQVLDILDERPLTIAEAAEVVQFILGEKATESFPEYPEVEKDAYLQAAQTEINQLPQIFDASQNQVVPWIDIAQFGLIS
jgi:hypothetical protein